MPLSTVSPTKAASQGRQLACRSTKPHAPAGPASNRYEPDTNSTRRVRKRARRACLSCRARKVRCNVVDGAPCSNCKLDMVQCVLPRIRRNRKTYTALMPALAASAELASVDVDHELPLADIHDSVIDWMPKEQPQQDHSTSNLSDLIVSGLESPTSALYSENDALRATSFSDTTVHAFADFPPYIKPPSNHLSTGHLEFLQAQGALSLPSLSLQYALVDAYAEFAYPYMPVVPIHDILSIIDKPKAKPANGISLLLYQAILFAGSAFVDSKALKNQEFAFSGRKLARKELSRRVMLLYDLGYETDNLALIQSALLMSSWSDLPHDRKDSWHWIGMAISLAYAVGLNRDPAGQKMSPAEQHLRKRIWWSCYMRDRFLALGLQRPTRVKDADCTVPELNLGDFDIVAMPCDNVILRSAQSALKKSRAQEELAELCMLRVELCKLVEPVLQVQSSYDLSVDEPASSETEKGLARDFERAEDGLDQWKASLSSTCDYRHGETASMLGRDDTVAVHRCHLHMTYYTLMYTLHRPRFLPTSPRMRKSTSRVSSDVSGAKVFNAALHITRMARELRERQLVEYLPVTGVTVIFPAMAISLLEMKSRDVSLRRGAVSRFSTCMQVMETLQETYVTAGSAISYFKAALHRASIDLKDGLAREEDMSTHLPSPEPLGPFEFQPVPVEVGDDQIFGDVIETPSTMDGMEPVHWPEVTSSAGLSHLDTPLDFETRQDDMGIDWNGMFDEDEDTFCRGPDTEYQASNIENVLARLASA